MAQVNLNVSQIRSLREVHVLVSLGRILERRQDIRVGTTLNAVDKVGDLGEEWVVVGVHVSLLEIVSGTTDVQGRGLVRVDESHVVTVRPDFNFTSIRSSLKGNSVSERADGAVLVLPDSRSQTGDSQLGRDLALVNRDLRELSRCLVVLDRSSAWDQQRTRMP